MTQLLLFAQQQGGQPAQGEGGGMAGSPTFLFYMIGLMMLFWIVVILPMGRRQKKEQEQMLANLKPGTRILTSGGIVATVVTAKDGEDEIVIRSEDTRLRIKRSVVIQVVEADKNEAAKN